MSDFSRYEAQKFLSHADLIDWQKQVVGHRITAYDDDGQPVRVEVETCVPNLMQPWKMEINGKYLVSVFELAFHINGEKLDPSTVKAFDDFFSNAEVSEIPKSPIILDHEREMKRLRNLWGKKGKR